MSWVTLILTFAAGAVLGVIYFTILWFSVQRFTRKGAPAAFAAASLARMGLVLAALAGALALGMDATGIAVSVAGFLLARLAATRMAGNPNKAG